MAGGLSGADLVEVAYVSNRPEAEMIQGLLEDGGIRCLLQQTGIDGPLVGVGFLPHSRHRVMVRASEAEAAQRMLTESLVDEGFEAEMNIADAAYLDGASGREPRSYGLIGGYARIYFWSLLSIALAFGVFLLLRAV